VLKDVVVGDVWLCAGQSNMGLTVDRVLNAEHEIATATYPMIRYFGVARNPVDVTVESVKGTWRVCSPQTVAHFSAVGYFFSRSIASALDVPIGIINTSWGGTAIEAWMSSATLSGSPCLERSFTRWKQRVDEYRQSQDHSVSGNDSTRSEVPYPPALFNSMLRPLAPYAIRGFVWYQGEANASYPEEYTLLLKELISDWRKLWQDRNLPFLLVQLPNFNPPWDKWSHHIWAFFREAQAQVLVEPQTAMAVTIDLGEADNIHPKNKQEVGRRLGLLALSDVYEKPIESSGPIFKSYAVSENKVTLEFTHAEGLFSDRPVVLGFEIAGEDKDFYPADATIVGSTVVVSSPKVKAPKAVRYAWTNNPEVTVYNSARLPLRPFRTDLWPRY